MELLKLDDRPAEFIWEGVTFFFRTQVTVGDKYMVDTSGSSMEGDEVKFSPWEFYKTMVRVFVTGWAGVTENNKPVPYSFQTLMNRLPGSHAEDLVMKLGLHIAKANGFLSEKKEKETEAKNV